MLLAEDGPRLTAFGPLGAAAEAEAGEGGRLSVRLGYLTPEQLAGEAAGPSSDLFVLGLLLAYAATGSTPLAAGDPAGAAERIAAGDPELDDVPDSLRDLVARCLAKDPADRPTAGTVAAELALEGAAALAAGGWLPDRLAADVTAQGVAAHRLAAEPRPGEAAPDVQDAVPPVPAWQEPAAASEPVLDTRTTQLKALGHQPAQPAAAPWPNTETYQPQQPYAPQPQPQAQAQPQPPQAQFPQAPQPLPVPPAPVPAAAPPPSPGGAVSTGGRCCSAVPRAWPAC